MIIRSKKQTFFLTYEGIDEASEWIAQNIPEKEAPKKIPMRLRLLAEELLLRWSDNFGEKAEAEISLEKTLFNFQLRITLKAEPFNPLSEEKNELDDWNSSLATALEIEPKYSYIRGENTIVIAVRRRSLNPVLSVVSAIAGGFLVSLLLGLFIKEDAQIETFSGLYDFTFNLWSGVLNALSAPVIFFSVITAIINTKNITKQGGTKTYVIGRYFLLSFLAAAIAFALSIPFFIQRGGIAEIKEGIFAEIMESFLSLIPKNIIEPFTDSNTPQLILLAFFVSGAVVALSGRLPELKKIIRQINMIGLLLAKWVSLAVPFFTFALIMLGSAGNYASAMISLWKPFVLAFAVSVIIVFLFILFFSFTIKVSASIVIKTLWSSFVYALKNASVDEQIKDAENSCVKNFGVNRSYAGASIPQGTVLYMPISSVGVLIFTVFAVGENNIALNPVQLASLILLAVILFVATPPVPGANLLAYIALFSWAGIPGSVLVGAMVFDIMFGIFAASANMCLLQIETAVQAKRIGMLDEKKLKGK